MDDPSLDEAAHRRALRGLRRINAVSGSVDAVWEPIERFVREEVREPARPWRLLDVACGGGDVTVGLWQRAKAAGLPIQVSGCDMSETALAFARQRAAAAGAEDVAFHRCDALNQPWPTAYDVVTCTLFLHHLDPPAVETLLRKMAAHAELVVIDDLVRSRAALAGTWVGVRVLSRSPVVHVDGPRSVRGAYTPDELRSMAERAGMAGAQIEGHFPWRMRLTWRRR